MKWVTRSNPEPLDWETGTHTTRTAPWGVIEKVITYLYIEKSEFRMMKSFIYLIVYKSSYGEDNDTLSLKNLRTASPEANVIKGLKLFATKNSQPIHISLKCMAWVQLAILSSGLLLRPTHRPWASVGKYYSFYRPKLAHQQILRIMFAKWHNMFH